MKTIKQRILDKIPEADGLYPFGMNVRPNGGSSGGGYHVHDNGKIYELPTGLSCRRR